MLYISRVPATRLCRKQFTSPVQLVEHLKGKQHKGTMELRSDPATYKARVAKEAEEKKRLYDEKRKARGGAEAKANHAAMGMPPREPGGEERAWARAGEGRERCRDEGSAKRKRPGAGAGGGDGDGEDDGSGESPVPVRSATGGGGKASRRQERAKARLDLVEKKKKRKEALGNGGVVAGNGKASGGSAKEDSDETDGIFGSVGAEIDGIFGDLGNEVDNHP